MRDSTRAMATAQCVPQYSRIRRLFQPTRFAIVTPTTRGHHHNHGKRISITLRRYPNVFDPESFYFSCAHLFSGNPTTTPKRISHQISLAVDRNTTAYLSTAHLDQAPKPLRTRLLEFPLLLDMRSYLRAIGDTSTCPTCRDERKIAAGEPTEV